MGQEVVRNIRNAAELLFKARDQGFPDVCLAVSLVALGGEVDMQDVIRYLVEEEPWMRSEIIRRSGLDGLDFIRRGKNFSEGELASLVIGPRRVAGISTRGFLAIVGNEASERGHALAVLNRADLPRGARRRMKQLGAPLAIVDINELDPKNRGEVVIQAATVKGLVQRLGEYIEIFQDEDPNQVVVSVGVIIEKLKRRKRK